MFILVDREDRENKGDLVIPAQMATPEAVNFMASYGRDLICLTLTGERIDQLGLPLMASKNSSRRETAFAVSIEAREGVETGISAKDRATTVAVAINPKSVPHADVTVIMVPGAPEVPTAIAMVERQADLDGYVASGCVIRGETTHYDTVCNDSSRAISLLGLQGVCIGNGILTVENRTLTEVRAKPHEQNKGGGAAAAALHLIALSRKWAGQTKEIGFRA